jgi:atypical dual specificity phosphatase
MKINWIDEKVLSAGGIPISRENLETLQKQGVRAIVTLTEHPLTIQKSLPAKLFADMGFDLFHMPIVDQTPPTKQQAMDVYTYLNQMTGKEKPVFVHCHAGIGRKGTILHAIELLRGSSLDNAKAKIAARRPVCRYIMLTESQRAFLESLADDLP